MLKFNPDYDYEDEIEEEELPWLVFRIKQNYYAVNGEIITSISILPEEITPIPESPKYVRGIVNVRDRVIPVLDTRTLFHLKDMSEEIAEFKKLIEEKKADFMNWLSEFLRCYKTGEEFTLPMDCHKCKFGMWYDNFEYDNLQVMFYFNQIGSLHKELHEYAAKLIQLAKENDIFETADEIYNIITQEIAPQILQCLDETASSVGDNSRIMTVTLEKEDESGENTVLSLIVDQVLSVENLEMLADDEEMKSFHESRFVCGVAKCEKYPGKLISLINKDTMFNISENIDF